MAGSASPYQRCAGARTSPMGSGSTIEPATTSKGLAPWRPASANMARSAGTTPGRSRVAASAAPSSARTSMSGSAKAAIISVAAA